MGNIALNRPTASSSYVMPYAPSRAVDGQYGTTTPTNRWLCNTLPGWMSVNLGTRYLVNRWLVRHMPLAGWQSPNFVNADFKLQGSNDNTTWYDIDTVVGNTTGITDRTFASAALFQYYRVYVTKGLNCNNKMASIMELEIYQAYSSLLTNLAISSGALTPAFTSGTFAYSATVTPDVASINVTPTALSPTAAIKVNNVTVASGQASPVALAFGSNTITVNVTDGGVLQAYTITVTRLASNYLSGLTAQAGTANIPLAPAFNKDTLGYTASVGYDAASITVTPTAENSTSTITVNGTTVASGSASGPISLNTGSNTITIVVTNAGNPRTYTLTVTRTDSSYLSALTVQSGSTIVALSPTPFVKTTMGYSATVGFDVTGVTVTPTAESGSASITVNGSPVVSGQPSAAIALAIGTTTIPVAVTAGGVTQTYTITITRVDTSLSGMTVKSGLTNYGLTPTFQSSIFSYTATALGKSSVNLTVSSSLSGSVIKVNGTQFTSGVSTPISLPASSNLFTITVTNSGGTTTYLLTINK